VTEGESQELVPERVDATPGLLGQRSLPQRRQRSMHRRFGAVESAGEILERHSVRVLREFDEDGENTVGSNEPLAVVLNASLCHNSIY
jgi:hypothetical protein